MIVKHVETLQFYDFDILFEAEDQDGRKYIAVNDGEDENGLAYKLAPVDEQALIQFKSGLIDLRSLMMTAPNGEWYRTMIGAETDEIQLMRQESPLALPEDTPEHRYYLLKFNKDDEEPADSTESVQQPREQSLVRPAVGISGRAIFNTNSVLLKSLLDDVEYGRIQLPDFQRGWVWDEDRIKDLLVSISNMFPIGAIMSLAAGGNTRFKTRPIEGVDIGRDTKPDTFLLDGQQRLTSLYQALRHPGPIITRNSRNQPTRSRFYMNMIAALDFNADRETIFISMPEDGIAVTATVQGPEAQDLSTPSLEYKTHMIPTERLMAPTGWATEYIRFWERSGEPHPHGDPSEFFKQFEDAVVANFNEYQLPVIELDKDASTEAVWTVFEKVNTRGVALNAFELATASFAAEAEAFSLRDDWEKRRENMYSFAGTLQGIRGDHFLQTINLLKTYEDRKNALMSGVPENMAPGVSNKNRDVLNVTLSDYETWADRVEQGFIDGAKFLQTQCIFKQRDVPYTTQLIPLAALYVELGPELNSAVARSRLEHWYWSGVFGELYAGTTDTQAELDLQQVARYVRKGTVPSTVTQATFTSERLISLRSMNSAASKGIHALLMKSGAADWMSGDHLGIVHFMDENIQSHHIFPIAWYRSLNIPSDLYNSIINRTPIDAATNRIMGSQAPSRYLPRLRNRVSDQTLERILSTHHLEIETLEKDDFATLFIQRGKRILEMVATVMQKDLVEGEEVFRGILREAGFDIVSEQDDLDQRPELLKQERSEEEQEYDEFGELAYEMAGAR